MPNVGRMIHPFAAHRAERGAENATRARNNAAERVHPRQAVEECRVSNPVHHSIRDLCVQDCLFL